MADATDILTVKAKIFHRQQTNAQLREIALQLCNRIEALEGELIVLRATKSKN